VHHHTKVPCRREAGDSFEPWIRWIENLSECWSRGEVTTTGAAALLGATN